MPKPEGNQQVQDKTAVFQAEYDKLISIFADVEEAKQKLVHGCIEDAAFLYAENWELRKMISVTGTIKVHPDYPDIQKPIPAAAQYLKNINSYAVIIKTLNSILSRDQQEQDDDMDEFIKQHKKDGTE